MITSVHNPRLQAVRRLQSHARQRAEELAFVVEGVRLAEEAWKEKWEALQVFHTESLDKRGQAVVDGFAAQGVHVEQVTDGVMKSISDTETPQGLLVVLRWRRLPIPSNPNFMLVLDGVRDPGNMGTILRSALAVKVQAVLLAAGNVDVTSPKVMRAGMGAHFRLPLRAMGWEEIRHMLKDREGGLKVYLADSAGGNAYTQADFRTPLALIIGGEAAGAGREADSLADARVHIPMPGGSESLNAAIAASILLFEVLRQRSN